MAFQFKETALPGVVYIEPQVHRDARGFFVELYKSVDFQAHGIPSSFAQVNQSKSEKNVLRGLHYQMNPAAQGKLVTVVSGEIFDVALDVRKGSPYYGQSVNVRLDSQTKNMLYVPEGFAHGFCVLSETAEIVYFCTTVYAPALERGIIWNDPDLAIPWPVKEPLLSGKDQLNLPLKSVENNFLYS